MKWETNAENAMVLTNGFRFLQVKEPGNLVWWFKIITLDGKVYKHHEVALLSLPGIFTQKLN